MKTKENTCGGIIKTLALAWVMIGCFFIGRQVGQQRVLVDSRHEVQQTMIKGIVNLHTDIIVKDWRNVLWKDSLIYESDLDSCMVLRKVETNKILKEARRFLRAQKMTN